MSEERFDHPHLDIEDLGDIEEELSAQDDLSLDTSPQGLDAETYTKFVNAFYNYELKDSERLRVIEALGKRVKELSPEAFDSEEGRDQILQEVIQETIGERRDKKFLSQKEQQRKRQVQSEIAFMVLRHAADLHQSDREKLTQIMYQGEYWKLSDEELRDKFERVARIFRDEGRLAA